MTDDNKDFIDLEFARRQLEMAKNVHLYDQRGLFAIADLPPRPSVVARAINPGWNGLDKLWRIYPGQFTIITGIPGHGKSTLALNVVCNVAKLHGWNSFLYVPENEPYLREKLFDIHGERGFDQFARECFVQSAEIEAYDQAPKTLQWVLDHAIVAIQRGGVKLLLIDPWNELEVAKPRDITMTDYITHCLMWLKAFARVHQVAIILVAHPTKAHHSESRKPMLYDIEGSAAWANKSDNGLIIHRDPETDIMEVTSAKVRERGAGKRGSCRLIMNDREQITDLSGV